MITAAPMRDSHEGFGLVSRTLHWGMALLFVWQFAGATLHALVKRSTVDSFFWQTHYSVGFTLFVLVLLRGLWGLGNLHRRPPHAGAPFERFAATVGQLVLYALMITIPPLMIYRAVMSGRGFRVYGIQLVQPGEAAMTREALAPLATLHIYLAWTLLAFIVIHAAIALIHAYVRRDATLDRMTKGASPLPLNPGSSID